LSTPPEKLPGAAGKSPMPENPGEPKPGAARAIRIDEIQASEHAQVNVAGGDIVQNIQYIYQTILPAAEAQELENLPPEPGDPPYPGLQYFSEADAGRYFGRELLTARLAGRLSGASFLAVIGASGSGKSSLLRAGLLPALRSGARLADGSLPPADSPHWELRLFTPGAHPLEALAACLLPQAESISAQLALHTDLQNEPRTLGLAARRLLSQGSKKRLLLVIDQFEEVYTQCRQPEVRSAFIENILAAVDPEHPQPVSILISLRADFYAQIASHDRLRERVAQNQEFIGAMTRDEMTRAILLPAQQGGWKIQEGLVEVILNDLGAEPGALPLLAHALLETWQRRRGRAMTLSGYTEAGGVRGAIARTAESVFQQRLKPEQQAVARLIFLRLTALNEEAQDTRRRVPFGELLTRASDELFVQAVLDILTEARLVTVDHSQAETTVEVAHEALIREWPTLRAWLEEDRAGLLVHRQLTEDSADWARLQRDPEALYRGLRLEEATAWAEAHPERLSLLEAEFLQAAQQARGARLAAEQAQAARLRKARRNQVALGGLAVLLAVGGILASLAASGFFAPKRMNGIYNIAIAEISYLDENGQAAAPVGEVSEFDEWIAAYLQDSLGSDPNILIWPNRERARLPALDGADPAAAALAAAALAAEIGADMLVYGVVDSSQQPALLHLSFWLAPQMQYNYEDLRGAYQAGVPIRLPDLESAGLAARSALGRQSEALALLAMGLVQVQLGESEAALAAFEQAAQADPQSPQVQFFIGRERLFLADDAQRSQEEQAAGEQAARAAFEQAIQLDPAYARAYIGLGSAYLRQAQREWYASAQDDPAAASAATLAGQAELAFQSMLELQPAFSDYGVPIQELGQVGLANASHLRGVVQATRGDLAGAASRFEFSIQTLQAVQATFETLAASQESQRRYLAQVYEYLGESYQWQGYLLYASGELEQAITSYEQAIQSYAQCTAQAENSPDLIIQQEIVAQRCQPYGQEAADTLAQLKGVP
jgi:hypothetical protein